MKKKYLIIILVSVSSITALLVVLGVIFNKTEYEKQQGLTSVYDVSSDGSIAYVFSEDGKPGIYFKQDGQSVNNPVLQLNGHEEILDVSFSPDGSTLAYIVSNKDRDSAPGSSTYLLDTRTWKQNEILNDRYLLTEIEFDPKDADLLFYLRARTFESYSPIARARPHNYDLFSFRISDEERTRYTQLNKYAMESLNVSYSEDSVFVQMNDDGNANTAEDIFASKQKIFRIPLQDPEDIKVVSKNNRSVDIFDFAIIPDSNEVIFQSISNEDEGGVFEYELYQYNWENKQEKQLTHLMEHASNPVINPKKDTVYFMVDKQFGKSHADYHLYQMDLDGENVEEIQLD